MPVSRRWIFARAFRNAVAICLVVALAGSCSSGHKKTPAGKSQESTASGSATRRTRVLVVGSTNLQRAGARGAITRATRHAVLAAAQRYVDRAILAPLETGKAGRGYPALFVPGLRPAATRADLRVLTDLAVGNTATLVEQPSPVALSGLADASGRLLYLATKFSVTVHVTNAGGPMTINRDVELTFAPVGNVWLVTAYRVNVTRTRPRPSRAAGTAYGRPRSEHASRTSALL